MSSKAPESNKKKREEARIIRVFEPSTEDVSDDLKMYGCSWSVTRAASVTSESVETIRCTLASLKSSIKFCREGSNAMASQKAWQEQQQVSDVQLLFACRSELQSRLEEEAHGK